MSQHLNAWRRAVVVIVVVVIVTACAGLTPDRITAVAALLTAVAALETRTNTHQLR